MLEQYPRMKTGLLLLGVFLLAQAPAPNDPNLQVRIQQLIQLIETKPSGVVVNEQVKVVTDPSRPAYQADGTRNQNFKVRPDNEHPSVSGIMHVEQNRENAVQELIRIGKPAVPALARAVMNEGLEFRFLYARALGEIGDLRAFPTLLKFYEDALNQLKVARAAASLDPVLSAEAERKGTAGKQAAHTALEKLSGQKLGDALGPWQAWWQTQKGKVEPLPVPVLYTANPPSGSSKP